jgi:lipoprotein-anchoring transpeptidase ErfK/SrfK
MKIINITKTIALTSMISVASLKQANSSQIYSQEMQQDTFERSITPQGVKDTTILRLAPKPDIVINGKKKKAGIIVDLTKNILYRYDKNGNPINAYLIASGKKSTPTDKGVRIVTHKEKFPYKSAIGTKRRRSPRDYGPVVICLKKLDPKTGEQSKTGEFIHGCRSYEKTFELTPDRYVSHGCMRMDNGVIKQLAPTVEKGEIIIIK